MDKKIAKSFSLAPATIELINLQRRNNDISHSAVVNNALNFYFKYSKYEALMQEAEIEMKNKSISFHEALKNIHGGMTE